MTQQREDWQRRGNTLVRTTALNQDQTKTVKDPGPDQDSDQDSAQSGPSRPQRPHRVLVQSASYQPGDSLKYRSRWLQGLDLDLDRDLDQDQDLNQDQDLDQDLDQDGFSVVLIGDHDVGKSSLASVFAGTSEEDQEENQERTFVRTLTVDGEDTTLRVMDTWDPNRSEQSMSTACTSCTAYILVYSVADRGSFEAAAELRIRVRRARQNESVPIIIVGNKSDLVRAREVTTEEGLACAVVFDCKYVETSAALDHGVAELFEGVVRQIRLHRDTTANVLTLTLTPGHAHRRKESLTQKARRLLQRVLSNQRVRVRARSKSCHDLAVL